MRNLIGSSISEYPTPFTSEQNKMESSHVYVTEEELFSIDEVSVPDSTKKATKFGNEVFKGCAFLLNFFSDKYTQDVFQNVLYTNDEWTTSRHPVKL